MDESAERSVIEAMAVLAKMTRTYYLSLIEQGFNAADAMTLTQRWLMAQAGGSVKG